MFIGRNRIARPVADNSHYCGHQRNKPQSDAVADIRRSKSTVGSFFSGQMTTIRTIRTLHRLGRDLRCQPTRSTPPLLRASVWGSGRPHAENSLDAPHAGSFLVSPDNLFFGPYFACGSAPQRPTTTVAMKFLVIFVVCPVPDYIQTVAKMTVVYRGGDNHLLLSPVSRSSLLSHHYTYQSIAYQYHFFQVQNKKSGPFPITGIAAVTRGSSILKFDTATWSRLCLDKADYFSLCRYLCFGRIRGSRKWGAGATGLGIWSGQIWNNLPEG